MPKLDPEWLDGKGGDDPDQPDAESLAKPNPDQRLRKESPAALQAFSDFVDLGPGRTLELLLGLYKKRKEKEGENSVPTLSISTLNKWSADFRWSERVYYLAQKAADTASADAAKRVKEDRERRVLEAQGLRSAGSHIIGRIIARIAAGELNDLPLLGEMVYPEKGHPYKRAGLLDLARPSAYLVKIGQDLERVALGKDDDERFGRLIDKLLADASPEEQAEMRQLANQALKELE